MRLGRSKGKLAALAGALVLLWSAGAAAAARPAAFPVDLGGPFALMDHTGRAVSDEDFRGRFMLVFFGYANCPGICPIGLRTMVEGRSWQGVDLFDHGSFIYLMGPDGKFLTLFPPVMPPEAMAAAIGRYLG